MFNNVHAGSWFGLPDFGITEAVGGLFGAPKTAQGGSNIVGPQNAATLGASTQQFATPANGGGYATYVNGGQNVIAKSNPTSTPARTTNTAPTNNTQAPVDPYAQIKSDIGNAWDNYIGSLNDLQPGLDAQRTAQENIANTQYNQNVDTTKQQQASSLRDIGNNIKNAFQAGNIYLGSRGAGDSSAANQYQFALSKEAGKQTGQLNEFVNGTLNKFKSEYDTQMQQIGSWFADAQNQIKQQIANGQLNKAQDINNLSKSILDQAIAAKNQIQQNAQNRYNALVEWAANNSSNVQQLSSNIAAIPQAIGTPQIDASGNIVAPTGIGSFGNDNKQQSIFQNPSWF